MTAIAIISLVASIIGPILVYIATKRSKSGKVATSEAADLWDEAQDFRQVLLHRLERSEDRIVELEVQLDSERGKNTQLVADLYEERKRNAHLAARNSVLEDLAGQMKRPGPKNGPGPVDGRNG